MVFLIFFCLIYLISFWIKLVRWKFVRCFQAPALVDMDTHPDPSLREPWLPQLLWGLSADTLWLSVPLGLPQPQGAPEPEVTPLPWGSSHTNDWSVRAIKDSFCSLWDNYKSVALQSSPQGQLGSLACIANHLLPWLPALLFHRCKSWEPFLISPEH